MTLRAARILLVLALGGTSAIVGGCARGEGSGTAPAQAAASARATSGSPTSWVAALEERIAELDRKSPGELGVYVKRLDGSGEMSYQAGEPRYLSSTIKVPIAILLLREVEAGQLSLAQELTLSESDYVDGAGELQRTAPGTRHSVARLLELMLVQSDSTATDMLIRLVGLDDLGDFLDDHGFSRATTILQVRHDAYAELHPDAAKLTNLDFIALKGASAEVRHEAFAKRLGVDVDELRQDSVAEAFERYYRKGLNSASMEAFGRLLEKLARGELLSAGHTDLVLGHMRAVTTGERRIKAGLPRGTPFAQKTGTQVGRVCNVGIVRPGEPGALVVAACLEQFDDQSTAEAVLKEVGRALAASGAS